MDVPLQPPRRARSTEIGIGHMPHVDLAKARAAVWENRHWLRQGKDPQEVKLISQKQRRTFLEVANLWIEKRRKLKWRGNSPGSVRLLT